MTTYYRTAQITPNDHGPLVNLASWMLMVTAILFTSFRLVSNVVLRGRFRTHDWIIIAATLLAVGQSIASAMMVANGLGQHEDTLSSAMLVRYEQSLLAANVLYIAALAANKLSLFVFLNEMLADSQRKFHKFMYAAWIILICYAISATFVFSFGCGLPKTYNTVSGTCINLVAFWDFHAVLDILVSFTIFLLPSVIVYPLHMDVEIKAQVVFPFALELPLCAFAIVRLVYIHMAYSSSDQTWAIVDAQIWTQVSMHLGTVAANIPCLKIFLKGFQSVLFRTDTIRLQPGSLSWGSGKVSGKGHVSRKGATESKHSGGNMFRRTDGESITVIATSRAPEPVEMHDEDTSNSQDQRIYKTTEWTVLESRGGES